MGTKLKVSLDDALYKESKIEVKGICGGCYCCGQQIHVHFKNIDILSMAKIDGTYYYVLICDCCEEDIKTLKSKGLQSISYDILWLIQGEFNQKLDSIEKEFGNILEGQRGDLLFSLYSEAYNKFKKGKNEMFPSLKDDDDL